MSTNPIGNTRPPNNQYDFIISDSGDNSSMDKMDFMKLMVAEMQNQDFTDPMDNSEMVAQMSQFANMQAIQEMTSYSKTNYAISLVGKTVTASRMTLGGDLDTITGTVTKMSLVEGEYVAFVDGKTYSLAHIMEVKDPLEKGESTVNPKNFDMSFSNTRDDSTVLTWEAPTEDTTLASKLTYAVYYSTEEEFNTIEEVEKGTKVGELKGATTMDIIDLDPSTIYYANVVVTDENGVKSVYKPRMVRTTEN